MSYVHKVGRRPLSAAPNSSELNYEFTIAGLILFKAFVDRFLFRLIKGKLMVVGVIV